jgi:hypothetical protein
MVGTIFGLGGSQQIDADGEPLAGNLLYVYQNGTSTPVTTYEDYGNTTGLELPFPMVADAAGRIPFFWLADGTYRVRLTDADGNEIFDESGITAIGASAAAASGGSVSTESTFDTGDMMWTLGSGARDGWVRANGRSIGNSASGATERANSDTSALFTFLWTYVSDTWAPVSGGRGASAAADFAANKRITIPSMQGRVPAGADDMGATAAGVLSGKTTVGESTGAETTVIASSAMPSHTHGPGTLATSTHAHTATASNTAHSHNYKIYASQISVSSGATATDVWRQSEDTTTSATSVAVSVTVAGTSALTVTSGVTAATGSGGVITITQPYRIGTFYIKL